MPFEGGDINGVGTDEVGCAPDFVAFQDGKRPPLDRTTRSAHLCERVKCKGVVGRQFASRAERHAESVQ
jgi:hypothetical protein